jgi:hypothetical protein
MICANGPKSGIMEGMERISLTGKSLIYRSILSCYIAAVGCEVYLQTQTAILLSVIHHGKERQPLGNA